jgi:hypothetical protein
MGLGYFKEGFLNSLIKDNTFDSPDVHIFCKALVIYPTKNSSIAGESFQYHKENTLIPKALINTYDLRISSSSSSPELNVWNFEITSNKTFLETFLISSLPDTRF